MYAIENDLAYVVDKVRNYYEIGEFKTDAEMSQADQAAATDLEKPDAKGRRSRTGRSKEEKLTPPTPKEEKPSRKTRAEVQAENEQKIAEHMAAVDEAIDKATGGAEEVPFDEAAAIADTVPKPDLQKPPRRTRKERQAEQEQGAETFICTEDTCFYIPDADNYVKKHAGDESPKGGKVITEDEFNAGLKRIAQENNPNPVDGAMNPPEPHARGQRRRRTR